MANSMVEAGLPRQPVDWKGARLRRADWAWSLPETQNATPDRSAKFFIFSIVTH
jgi:hypothetical protein